MLRFTVYGLPQSTGSKRHVGKGRIIDSNPKAREWKNMVADAARQAYLNRVIRSGFDGGAPIMAPELVASALAVTFTFHMPRPKGHYLPSGELNATGRRTTAPTTRPDVLKLARAVEDALTGVIWRDDSQIVTEVLRKVYGEPARVEIGIKDGGE